MVDAMTALTTHDMQHLRNQISRGQVILFTGAGFSRDASNRLGERLPSSPELAGLLFAKLYPDEPFDESTELGELYAVAAKRDPRGVEELMGRHLSIDPTSLPEYYRIYFSFPWPRVYTLNVDELENAVAQRFELPRQPLLLSALDPATGSGAQRNADGLQVVHLNGRLTDSLGSMTFSESQYGERLAQQEPWYTRCATDIKTRPVLFVGTTLQESLLWQHLALRRRERPEGTYIPSPASIVISPHLSRVRAEMLRELNVSWFQGDAQSFAERVLTQLFRGSDAGHEGSRFLWRCARAPGRPASPGPGTGTTVFIYRVGTSPK